MIVEPWMWIVLGLAMTTTIILSICKGMNNATVPTKR
jgi:hypothetical protein